MTEQERQTTHLKRDSDMKTTTILLDALDDIARDLGGGWRDD
jgi:hypothetical protein